MLRESIRWQWRAARHWILVAAMAAASLPVVSAARRWTATDGDVATFLSELELWGYLYPLLAVAAGIALGVSAWRSDRQNGFVYSLILPVERSRMILLRWAALFLVSLPVALALWGAGLAVVGALPLPETVRGYPTALALKYLMAQSVAMTIAFVLASLPGRQVRRLAWAMALVLSLQAGLALVSRELDLLTPALRVLLSPLGPLGAFGGRWMLIDV